jgi:hypothetical protein
MITKVACTKCGAEILPSTAETTGGLCMPCKKGTRAQIDAAIEYKHHAIEEEKKYEPFATLWKSLVKRVYDPAIGYAALTDDERLIYSVNYLRGDIDSGGMYSYFSDTPGSEFRDALAGLEKLGATNTRALAIRAKEILFGDAEPADDMTERNAAMKELPIDENAPQPEWDAELDEIDEEFYEDKDNLFELVVDFAVAKGFIPPIEH